MSLPTVSLGSDTNHAAATVYYPDDEGVSLDGCQYFGIGLDVDDCTVGVEATVDGTNWVDITAMLIDQAGGWLGGPIVFAAPATANWQTWFLLPVAAESVRLAVTYPDATNAFEAWIVRRS